MQFELGLKNTESIKKKSKKVTPIRDVESILESLTFNRSQIEDVEFKHPFTYAEYCSLDGYEYTHEGETHYLKVNYIDSDKLLTIRTTDWSASCGGIHVTGHISMPSIYSQTKEDFESGSRGVLLSPKGFEDLVSRIKLTRVVTVKDRTRYPDRFEADEIGERTGRFDTKTLLMRRAENFAKTYFPGFKIRQD